MDLLVCGGAGYIGSYLSKMLVEQGHRVIVLDNLSVGERAHVDHPKIKFVAGNLLNDKDLYLLFNRHKFDGVFHLATISPYSINNNNTPHSYRNNITGTMNLLGQMRAANVDKIVFASSGLVYGSQIMVELDETAKTAPGTVFGTTNSTVETMLSDFHSSCGLNSVSLRFNNASGSADQYHRYYWHDDNPPELVRLLQAFQSGDAPAFNIPGDKHPTRDGTLIRDYIHVLDVCDAFIKSMTYLEKGEKGAQQINLGSQGGLSYKSLLKIAELVTGNHEANTSVSGEFDPSYPAVQTLSSAKAKILLGWEPQYSAADIMKSLLWQAMNKPQPEDITDITDITDMSLQRQERDDHYDVAVDSSKTLMAKLKFWNRMELSTKIAK